MESTRGGRGNFAQASGQEATATPSTSASWRLTVLAAGLIVFSAVAAYHNSFAGPFIYDDVKSIVENRTIRRLWPVWPVLSPPRDGRTVSSRPLLNVSLAINYALGGLHPWGYHAVNLVIHIAAALLLFGILRRTFLMPTLPARFGGAATFLALAGAMLWTVHPLHTESVTYIAQRAESLVGFFYLLTLYCVIRGGAAAGLPSSAGSTVGQAGHRPKVGRGTHELGFGSSLLWYIAAVLACLLGMASKEVMVTAPLMVLLYDRTFLAGSFREALRRRWGLYLGLAATWGLLGYLVFSTGLIVRQPEMGAPDAWSYARTQPGVILHYLRLSVWPRPLCFDYGWQVADTLGEILPGVLAVGMLLAATLWGLLRRKTWGFLGAWFLLILAPTSSIMPLGQLAFEHRTYLSLAAVAVLVTAGGYALWDWLLHRPAGQGADHRGQSPFSPGMTLGALGWRAAKKETVPAAKKGTVPGGLVRWAAPVAAWGAVVLTLGAATVARNRDYRSSLAIWQDAVNKRPNNAVAHGNLGVALAAEGQTAEALEHYSRALRLKRDYAEAHNNLGLILAGWGKTAEAIQHYREALRLKPDYAKAYHNLGDALADLGKFDEAIQCYRQALQLQPDYAAVHNNLGVALAAVGETSQALEHYHEVLRLKPDYPGVHNNLGALLATLGRTDEAIEHYRAAVQLKPDYAEAHNNLAVALAGLGRTAEAIDHYQQFLHVLPDSIAALNNLAWLLATQESSQGGDPARAVQLAQRARDLSRQENAQCLDTLAAAYAAAGRFAEAVATAEKAVQLAKSTGQTTLARKIQSRLELYRAGRPYRETPRAAG